MPKCVKPIVKSTRTCRDIHWQSLVVFLCVILPQHVCSCQAHTHIHNIIGTHTYAHCVRLYMYCQHWGATLSTFAINFLYYMWPLYTVLSIVLYSVCVCVCVCVYRSSGDSLFAFEIIESSVSLSSERYLIWKCPRVRFVTKYTQLPVRCSVY